MSPYEVNEGTERYSLVVSSNSDDVDAPFDPRRPLLLTERRFSIEVLVRGLPVLSVYDGKRMEIRGADAPEQIGEMMRRANAYDHLVELLQDAADCIEDAEDTAQWADQASDVRARIKSALTQQVAPSTT